MWTEIIVIVVFIVWLFLGIRIVRPVEVGVVERFGKFKRIAKSGLHWIIPLFDHMIYVNMTERMVDVLPQMVITKDKLNATVDAVVYYKIVDSLKSLYNVDDHKRQIVSLSRTTLRAVVGKKTLTQANEERSKINNEIETVLDKETQSYGVDVLRVEIQKIEPPSDVQDSMNKVVKAEQEKIAALDSATAVETKADGERRAEIKRADGAKQANILESEGDAEAIIKVADARAKEIKLVNESLQKHFKGDAQIYAKLKATESALKRGTKYVIDSKSGTTLVFSEAAGITPIKKSKK